jgi:hypothetical protein
MPAGMLVTSEAIPSSAVMNAAPATLEPRANDDAAITGIIAPSARPNSVPGA